MSIFTISSLFLSKIESNHHFDILLDFTKTDNPLKVAIDDDGFIIDQYRNAILANDKFAETLKWWLDYMSNENPKFEYICVIPPEYKTHSIHPFFYVAKEVEGDKILIVYSKRECKGICTIKGKCGEFENRQIQIYDRDEARQIVKAIAIQSHAGSGDNIAGDKIIHNSK